jgi:hypothetical protein
LPLNARGQHISAAPPGFRLLAMRTSLTNAAGGQVHRRGVFATLESKWMQVSVSVPSNHDITEIIKARHSSLSPIVPLIVGTFVGRTRCVCPVAGFSPNHNLSDVQMVPLHRALRRTLRAGRAAVGLCGECPCAQRSRLFSPRLPINDTILDLLAGLLRVLRERVMHHAAHYQPEMAIAKGKELAIGAVTAPPPPLTTLSTIGDAGVTPAG